MLLKCGRWIITKCKRYAFTKWDIGTYKVRGKHLQSGRQGKIGTHKVKDMQLHIEIKALTKKEIVRYIPLQSERYTPTKWEIYTYKVRDIHLKHEIYTPKKWDIYTYKVKDIHIQSEIYTPTNW